MNENELLLTRMEDLVDKAQRTGFAASKFLTPAEQVIIQQAFKKRKDIVLDFEGGSHEAERQVAVFVQPDWGSYQLLEVLAVLELQYRPQDEVRHQDVLGSILGLGLSRDVIGDIYLDTGAAQVVCLVKIAGTIAGELVKVGRVGITVSTVPLSNIKDTTSLLTEKQLSIASLRLDVLVAGAFNWSRTKAVEAILSGKVQLAHEECQNISQTVAVNDIISVRGKGRVKLLEVNDFSRKGRQRIVLGYYG